MEIAAKANPPVCRIVDYGKHLYQLNKREHDARKHQKSIEVKEVKFRPRTSKHDFEIKRNRIIRFLGEGDKVKATVVFRGRERAHKEIGWDIIERLLEDIAEVGMAEFRLREEGPSLIVILAPKKVAATSRLQKRGPRPAQTRKPKRIRRRLRRQRKSSREPVEKFIRRKFCRKSNRRRTAAPAKRFKVTGSGKVKRKRAFLRHILTSKTAKQKRKLRKAGLVSDADRRRISALLPYA